MRTPIVLTSSQIERLNELAKQLNCSWTELISRAIDQFLEQNAILGDEAFGSWSHSPEDGIELQHRLRSEWESTPS